MFLLWKGNVKIRKKGRKMKGKKKKSE